MEYLYDKFVMNSTGIFLNKTIKVTDKYAFRIIWQAKHKRRN